MVKKSNKNDGMQDMFVQKRIAEETAEYESARAKLEGEIEQIERASNDFDSGLTNSENRNDIRYLNEEIRYLEKKYYDKISKLKSNQK